MYLNYSIHIVLSSEILIRGLLDHLHENNLLAELEQTHVSNSTTCSTNSRVELFYVRVYGVELKKNLEQSSAKHPDRVGTRARSRIDTDLMPLVLRRMIIGLVFS